MDCAYRLCVQVEHQTLNTLCGPGIFEKRCTLASHWIAFARTSNIESGCFYACSNLAFQGQSEATLNGKALVSTRLTHLAQSIICSRAVAVSPMLACQGAIIHTVTARLCMLEQQIMCDTWNFWESDSSILQRH